MKLKIPNEKLKQMQLEEQEEKPIKIAYNSDGHDANSSKTFKKGLGALSQNKLIRLKSVKDINDDAF